MNTPNNNEELNDLRISGSLDDKLTKALLGGYSKSSVKEYIAELNRSTEQLKFSLEKQIRDLSVEKTQLTKESSVLRKQIADTEASKNAIQIELQDVVKERDEAMHKNQQADTKIQELSEAVESYASLEDTVFQYQKQLEDSNQQLQIMQSENETLKQQTAEVIKKNDDLSGKIACLQSAERSIFDLEEAKQLQNHISELEQAVKVLKQQLNESQKQAADAQNNVEAIKAEAKKTQDNLFAEKTRHDEIIDQLKCENEKVTKEHSELSSRYSLLHEKYRETISQSEHLATERAALTELLEQYQNKEKEYALLRKKDEEQNNTICDLESTVVSMLQEMENQLQIFENITKAHTESKELICKLTKEKTEIQVQNVDLLEKLEVLSHNSSMLEQEKSRLNKLLQKDNPELELENGGTPLKNQRVNVSNASNSIKRAQEISKVFLLGSEKFENNTVDIVK